MLAADEFTPADETLIPTGKLAPVKGTPLDFTSPTPIGARFDQLKGDPIGYDHNYVFAATARRRPSGRAGLDPESGRVLEMFTTEPGVQLYTANFLDGKLKGKGASCTRSTRRFAWRPSIFPTRSTIANFPSIDPAGRARSIHRRRSTSSRRGESACRDRAEPRVVHDRRIDVRQAFEPDCSIARSGLHA